MLLTLIKKKQILNKTNLHIIIIITQDKHI